MRKSSIALATALVFAAGSAFAFHCPQDMKKIDDALAKNPKLDATKLAEVKKYRAEGEALHKAGKHQESLDTLGRPKRSSASDPGVAVTKRHALARGVSYPGSPRDRIFAVAPESRTIPNAAPA
jgi:hypothetical protein